MRTVFIVTLLSTLLLAGSAFSQPSGPAEAVIELANLDDWEIIEENRINLNAPSNSYGSWERKVLALRDTVKVLEVNIFRGTGPGKLYIPDSDISENDRPIGHGATYETVIIKGHRGIFEVYPHMGKALSVEIPPHTILCFESKTLNSEELKKAAAAMLPEATSIKQNGGD